MPRLPSPLLAAFDRSWRMKTLPNGLRVAHIPLERDERFYLGATVRAGARYEPATRSGLSHFLEHMMFRGSRNYPSFPLLAKAFEWLGGEWNAATGYEHTEYWYSGHRRTAGDTIGLFHEFLAHPRLLDIETERDIVKRELMKELNEYGHSTDLDHHSLAQMWPGSSLARPILGDAATIGRFTKADLERYRASYYLPSNMVICAIGGSDEDGVLAKLEKGFAGYSVPGQGRAPSTPPDVTMFRGPKIKWVNHSDNEYQIQMSFPTVGEWDPAALGVQMLCRILGDGFSSRLASHLREKLGLVYEVDATASLMSDVGSVDINANVGPKELVVFFRELLGQLEKLVRSGPTAEEIERTQRRSLMDLELGPSDPESLSYRFGWALLMGRKPSLAKVATRLDGVNRAGLHKLAGRIFRRSRLSLVVLGPENAPLSKKVNELIRAAL